MTSSSFNAAFHCFIVILIIHIKHLFTLFFNFYIQSTLNCMTSCHGAMATWTRGARTQLEFTDRDYEFTTSMERCFTARELMITRSRLQWNAASEQWCRQDLVHGTQNYMKQGSCSRDWTTAAADKWLNLRRGGVQRSKLGGIPYWGRSELGAQSGRKNQPACYRCLSVGECCHLCQQNHVLYVEHYTFDTVAAQQVPTAARSTAASIPRPLGRLLHVQMIVCWTCWVECWIECSIRVFAECICIVRRGFLPKLRL